jgi:peptidoglycan/LPS O-acetylase OafA/YrhL
MKHVGPPRRIQIVLPGLVIALAGAWLLTYALGGGPVTLVEWTAARWNTLICGIVLTITGASGWLWSRTAVGVAGVVGTWLLVAPVLMRYDDGDVFLPVWIEVMSSIIVMLATDRWASNVSGPASDDR